MFVHYFDWLARRSRPGVCRALVARAALAGVLLVSWPPVMAGADNRVASVSAPSVTEQSSADGASAELSVTDAWVRAVPPNARSTAAYFVLHNDGKTSWRIRSVSADIAGAAELHRWFDNDGVKKMVRQTELPLAAGAQLSLAPGGLHMMLFRLDPVPAPGESVRICLQLERDGKESTPVDGDEYCFAAEVRRP